MAVALDLVAEGPDHLAVAGVAALADVDVAAGELERACRAARPSTRSIVLSIVNRGTISTRPPNETVTRMKSGEQQRPPLGLAVEAVEHRPALRYSAGEASAAGAATSCSCADVAPDRAPDIVGHDQAAGQEEHAAERADHVVGVHRCDGLDEGVLQEAEAVVGAPHQALHDAGDPHRRDVEDDAERRDPEMPLDQLQRVEPLATPQARHQVVDGAEGDERDPAQGTGMDVAHGPVGVVAEGIDLTHAHERALQGAHAVEGDRDHEEAKYRVGAQLVPGARERHHPFTALPQEGIHSMIVKVMPMTCAQSGRAV